MVIYSVIVVIHLEQSANDLYMIQLMQLALSHLSLAWMTGSAYGPYKKTWFSYIEFLKDQTKIRVKSGNVYQVLEAVVGPVAPISVNFNYQLAYFADQSDTTHVPHQPTAVA